MKSNVKRINGVKVNEQGKSNFVLGTAIYNIFEAIMVFFSWFILACGSDGVNFVLYTTLFVGLGLNIASLVKQKKLGQKIWGSVCCVVGMAMSSLCLLLALPTFVLLIVGLIPQFTQKKLA